MGGETSDDGVIGNGDARWCLVVGHNLSEAGCTSRERIIVIIETDLNTGETNRRIQATVERVTAVRRRASHETTASEKPTRSKRMVGRFIRGPIPLAWLVAATGAGTKSLNVALALWHQDGMKRGESFRVTPGVLAPFSVSPRTARQTLARFESLGLVTVEFARGRGPLVTILDCPSEDLDGN